MINKLLKAFPQSGFTLMETVIGVGVTAVMGVGLMQIMEGTNATKKAMERDSNIMTIARLLEGKLMSRKGCDALIGKKIGDQITLAPTGTGSESISTGRVAVENSGAILTFKEFSPTEDSETSGIARITVTMPAEKKSLGSLMARDLAVDIFMPVSMAGPEEGQKSIESCNMSYIRTYEEVQSLVCGGTYGNFSRNSAGCSDTMVNIWKAVAEDICDDLYGPSEGDSVMTGPNSQFCNLALVHAGQACPGTQKMRGFDSHGRIDCVN